MSEKKSDLGKTEEPHSRPLAKRRQLLKTVGLGAAGAATVEHWTKPVLKQAVLPAHAGTSVGNINVRLVFDTDIDGDFNGLLNTDDIDLAFNSGDTTTNVTFTENPTMNHLRVHLDPPLADQPLDIDFSTDGSVDGSRVAGDAPRTSDSGDYDFDGDLSPTGDEDGIQTGRIRVTVRSAGYRTNHITVNLTEND